MPSAPHTMHSNIKNTSQALLFAGWVREAEEVKQPSAFLRFLVLHELAHLLNNWGKSMSKSAMSGHSIAWGGQLPNPSLHPKCYSGLRPLAHSGELKR